MSRNVMVTLTKTIAMQFTFPDVIPESMHNELAAFLAREAAHVYENPQLQEDDPHFDDLDARCKARFNLTDAQIEALLDFPINPTTDLSAVQWVVSDVLTERG